MLTETVAALLPRIRGLEARVGELEALRTTDDPTRTTRSGPEEPDALRRQWMLHLVAHLNPTFTLEPSRWFNGYGRRPPTSTHIDVRQTQAAIARMRELVASGGFIELLMYMNTIQLYRVDWRYIENEDDYYVNEGYSLSSVDGFIKRFRSEVQKAVDALTRD